MVRVLSREESVRRGTERQAHLLAAEDQARALQPRGAHPWFDHPADAAEHDRVLARAVDVATEWFTAATGRSTRARGDARRAVRRLLEWLETFPGASYQDKWVAADTDARPGDWCPEMSAGQSQRHGARLAANAVIMLGVIRPTHTWLFDNKQSRFWRDWTFWHDQAFWTRYFAEAEAAGTPDRRKWWGAEHLIRICVVTGLSAEQVTGEQVVRYRHWLTSSNRSSGDLFSMWHFARRAGLFPGEPEQFGELVNRTQRTPTDLVDRYGVRSPRVRGLLIEYLTEVSATRDYGSLVGYSEQLVKLFWRTIEQQNPGIDTIVLTREQAVRWKESVRTLPNGNPRRNADSVLSAIRAFYLDLAAWAHEAPGTWAEWAVPCPVSVADVRGHARRRRERTSRMQSRTRTLAPHLPALLEAARRRHERALELQTATLAAQSNVPFECGGTRYIRASTRQERRGRRENGTGYVAKFGEATRIDTDARVRSTFLLWSALEVLRHTGVRLEELLELTHLSIQQYRKPDGSILPLLQIAPGKTDEERVIPCSPELTAVLARLVRFVSIDGVVPLCSRRDEHELTYSPELPHLFQIRAAGRSRVLTVGAMRLWLMELLDEVALTDRDGTPIRFTPHDFRRLFITDIVNNGFPIHLAAKIVGHRSLEVTAAYTAVYQRDVFDAYERHITARRERRPSAEYREPTQLEWAEFVEHFGQRKIALGNCRRPYGSPCVHEHACVRCDFLQVEPGQVGRLEEIRDNLHMQVEEATQHAWLGDVEQLRLTITHADRKLDQLRDHQHADTPALHIARPI